MTTPITWRKSSRSGTNPWGNCVESASVRTYTHPSVYAGIAAGEDWADPQMDPTRIDWAPRQDAALIPFTVDEHGPVNPCEDTDIWFGRNELGHWGEQPCADALVLAELPDLRRWVLMVERADGHGWALPGGHVDPDDETLLAAAVRELEEETSLVLPAATWRIGEPRYVPDPRASRQSWMVTAAATTTLDVEELPRVEGRDDARRAAWIHADTYKGLTAHLAQAYGGTVFAAHVDMLQAALEGPCPASSAATSTRTW